MGVTLPTATCVSLADIAARCSPRLTALPRRSSLTALPCTLQSPLAGVASFLTNSVVPLIFRPLHRYHSRLSLHPHHPSRRRDLSSRLLAQRLSAMGASSSTRFHRSTADDVVHNLVRALDDLLDWEGRAARVKQITTASTDRTAEEAETTAGGGRGGITTHSQNAQHNTLPLTCSTAPEAAAV